MKKGFLLCSIILALSACSKEESTLVTQPQAEQQPAAAMAQTAEQAYLAMVDQFFKDYLKLEPIYATFVGVNDYNDTFGGDLSELTSNSAMNSIAATPPRPRP